MRLLLVIVTIILSACGQSDYQSDWLTDKKWKIQKVENLKTGQFAPDELNRGITWVFHDDHTAMLKIKNDFTDEVIPCTWSLTESTLTVVEDNDTTLMKIGELTETTLNWIVSDPAEGSVKVYLTTIIPE